MASPHLARRPSGLSEVLCGVLAEGETRMTREKLVTYWCPVCRREIVRVVTRASTRVKSFCMKADRRTTMRRIRITDLRESTRAENSQNQRRAPKDNRR